MGPHKNGDERFHDQVLSTKSKKNRNEEKLLHKKVNDLQVRAENNPHNRNILLELQRARSQLKKIMLTKTKGTILRSKVRWHEEGERNTKYFYNLEKRHHDIKTVSKLFYSFMSRYTAPPILIPKSSKIRLFLSQKM